MAPNDSSPPAIRIGARESNHAGSAARPSLLAYFAPDFTEVSTITRARGFLDRGLQVAVFGFRRGRYNPRFKSPWLEVELGRTRDGAYLQRALALCGAIPAIWSNRRLLREARVLYARNIDQLALAFFARLAVRSRGRLVYEVLDIASAFVSPGLAGRMMRFLERALLKRIDRLVVSSPAFLREYYVPIQKFRGRTSVIENRLDPTAAAAIARRPAVVPLRSRFGRYKWTVGYFGLIRGQRTFDLMTRLAERFADDVLFYFRGVVTTVDPQAFAAAIDRHDNMIYGGPYVNPDDLAELYGSVDLAWAIDLEFESHNSRWLMPCRFYEASLLGVPCLAARDFEVGNRIDSLGIGWTIAAPYDDSLSRLLSHLTRADYDSVTRRLDALPRSMFVSGDDIASLCRAIDGAAAP